MNEIINKFIYLSSLFIGVFFIYKNNQDLNDLQLFLIFFMYISTITIAFLPLIKPIFIGKLPLIYLVNLYFLICYLGIFVFDKYKILSLEKYNKDDHTAAINTLFLGYSFFLIGYFFVKKIFKNYKRKSISYLETSTNETLLIGIPLLILVIIFFYLFNIQNYFKFLSQLKYILLLFSIGLCFDIVLKKSLKNLITYFLLILIILPIFFELLEGSYNFPFMVLILMYAQYSVNREKINIIPFLLVGFIFLIIHSGKYDYRHETWYEKNNDLNLLEKSKIFLNYYLNNNEIIFIDGHLTKKNLFNIGSDDNYKQEKRIFHSYWSLLIVTKNTPKLIPYWQGYSYQILKSKLIPRIFWKNKPSDRLGNEFGHRYNVLTKDTNLTKKDISTSWNMPVLNEFYVNYGNLGVSIGMFIIGIIIGLLTKISSFGNNSNLEIVISFYLFLPLFFFESHLSLLFGAIIQSYIFLLIFSFCYLFLLRKLTSIK